MSYSGRLSTFFGLIGILLLLGSACQAALPPSDTPAAFTPSPSPSPSLPQPSATPPPAQTRTPRPTSTFAPPSQLAVTSIPAPVTGIQRPEEVMVLVIVLNQRPASFLGLSQAVMVVFYHPRLGRASLLPLPPDLLVYIPGFTMQRLQIAQPLGGIRLLNATLAYNLGVWPDYWLLLTPDRLASLIDRLGGLDLNIARNYPQHCGGIPGGPVYMTGEQALCFIEFRDGMDEDDRGLRQQEVFRQIVHRLAGDGRLARLEAFYQDYWGHPNSNIGLAQWKESIPLILKLADPNRIGFFSLFDLDRTVWRLPAEVEAFVLLPQPQVLEQRVQAAIDYVLTPMPLSELYLTRQAALTTTPTFTPTPLGGPVLPTATFTITLTASLTPGFGTVFPTDTPTLPGDTPGAGTPSPTFQKSPTETGTPGPTWTPSFTPEDTSTPIPYPVTNTPGTDVPYPGGTPTPNPNLTSTVYP